MEPHKMDIDDADDPVTATYQVYLNPALPLGRRLLVLQHPNRIDEASAVRASPTEVRLKSASGMVEVDVPLETSVAYDREKGLAWGRALHSSMTTKSGGSHGLAGGFGFGAVPLAAQRGVAGRRRGGAAAQAEAERFLGVLDWNEAVRQDKVLRTQTLGGQAPDGDEVQYMVGVFQGKDLHLTPVSSLVLLRPQLHHIDAATQQERTAAAASRDGSSSSTSGPAARAIHMTIKTTSDGGDTVTTETMADRLRSVQSEPWRKMRYIDENDEAAWDVYNQSLFLKPAAATTSGASPSSPSADVPASPLADCTPSFASKWTDKQFLEAVSGITKREPPSNPDNIKPEARDSETETGTPVEIEIAPKPKSRASGTRRGARAKASTTINID